MLDRDWEGNGTTLWQLCKTSLSTIRENCYWIPGNGKRINIWKSNILGQPPRSSLPRQTSLADWASEKGIFCLHDLSLWDAQGHWAGWKELSPPAPLKAAADSLLASLHGMSPSRIAVKDRIGWGDSGKYNVKEGYKKIVREQDGADQIWKKVWKADCIPKVNSFIWLLCHNKLLTAENLRKRGINGPSRCPLCNSDEESSNHLFLQCKFSLLIWGSVLPHGMDLHFPDNAVHLFREWNN